ncbi:hypothetical protein [Thermoanaerobacterium sp. RBIITD]|uniref:hypothetical protein n=1 Tax=Thermoanaerobacterium sp. RBIITD TaxID=1550240 RepID=UPI000BB9A830|nr:hypothetical protein [Thermoanaerobacterium sp. RBIITD]SNX54227.1 hypothetical protein SAMN05660242_1867 [Thermoanaerobacterium sp. RBIITD]
MDNINREKILDSYEENHPFVHFEIIDENGNSCGTYNDNLIRVYLPQVKEFYDKCIEIVKDNKFCDFTLYDCISYILDHELIHHDIEKNIVAKYGYINCLKYAEYLFLSEAIVNYKQYINYHKNNRIKFSIIKSRLLDLIDVVKNIHGSSELYGEDKIKKPKPIEKSLDLRQKEYSDEQIIDFYGSLIGCQLAYNKVKDNWNDELNNFNKKNSIFAEYLNQFSEDILSSANNCENMTEKLLNKIQEKNDIFIRQNGLRTYI